MVRFSFYFSLILSFSVIMGCGPGKDRLFTALDKDATGINFQNTIFEDGPLNVANYIYFYNGGGVAVGDINNDGLQDILFTGNMVKNRLFLNKGNFKFEDITDKSGVALKQGWCTGATMADINGDGKMDIYICRSADKNPALRKNLLFINNGDLTFSEKAEEYGLADEGYSTQASFFDYDKDGDLDCFIINHSTTKYTASIQDNVELRKEYNADFAAKLYQNDNGHYKDVSREAGIISSVFTFGLGLAVSDVNNDGWPDIYISNDFNEPDYLFINNGNGVFTESLSQSMDHVSMFSMGSDAADYNNDGLVDIVTLDMLAEDNNTQKMHSGQDNFDKFQLLFNKGFYYQYSRNMLQKNNGDGTFSETGQLAGISNTDWSWSALFSDYDNDGYKDLFVTNGYVKDYSDMDFMKYSMARLVREMHGEAVDAVSEYIKKMPAHERSDYIFQNNGNETFSKKNLEWGFDKKGVSAGAAYADLDNDGDMDLIVSNTNDFAGIYRNNSDVLAKNNYLKVKLIGDAKNGLGTGAKVTVYCKNNKYYQEQITTRGFQSAVDPVMNFGIGKIEQADSLIVIWPDDRMQKFTNLKANQTLSVNIKDATSKWDYIAHKEVNKYFVPGDTPLFEHKENIFNDFTEQTLLLRYYSRQGPCMAKGDINKDGREDLFIGGAKNQPSRIFVQTADGRFMMSSQSAIASDSLCEDVGAEFFDADGDGDLDLYVVSGGYEFKQNDIGLQDRLYFNDGRGLFSKNEKALPRMLISGACVKSADIDGDGDLDLFIGGRVVPGKYPNIPESRILTNDGKGNFADATGSIASELSNVGMVTDAVWLDINKDKLPDLIVAGEWMPLKVFINYKGKLKDESASYFKFATGGWWNRILADDFDGDGDTDLVVGNQGWNAQFRASEKEPVSLYYKDFDGNGSIDPVFCYFIQGVSYPFASRDDLAEQVPSVKKKFPEYHNYADAAIQDVFTETQMKDARLLKAETMSTTFFENDNGKGFVKKELPAEMQYAPVYALASMDINGDGKKDIIAAGNNSWTRIKFGRFNASYGTILLGDGKGNFTYVPQWKSGLNVKGDVRSIEKIVAGNGTEILFGVNNSAVKSFILSK